MTFPWTSIKRSLYRFHFSLVTRLIKLTTRYKCRSLGLALGTLLLELTSAVNAAGRRLYYKNPLQHGINHFHSNHRGKNPVILIHGRLGKWADLMDLALSLRNANIPVFVIDLENARHPTEKERRQINKEIAHIQSRYEEAFNESCPQIDIVGHSLGGDLALYTAFDSSCSIIEEGSLKFKCSPQPNPSVGKIITLGMPTSSCEAAWIWSAGKKRDIFNVIAKFDAIMGSKKCALLPHQVFEVESGHLGLLNMATYLQVLNWLLER